MAGVLCGLGAGKTVGWLAGQDDDFGCKTASSLTARRMPRATSANASSRIVPTGHGFPIGRQGLKLAERGALPAIDLSEEDGDHAGLTLVVPLQGAASSRRRSSSRRPGNRR